MTEKNVQSTINSFLNDVLGKVKETLVKSVQEHVSDAVYVIKNFNLSSEIYDVLDVNKTLIAYAWYDENKQLIVHPIHLPQCISKRVN